MADGKNLKVIKISHFRRENLDLVMIQVEESQIRHFLDDFRWNDGDLVLEGVKDAEMTK